MPEIAGGTGEALNASVTTVESTPEQIAAAEAAAASAEQAAKDHAAAIVEADRIVAACRIGVEKNKGHLATAEKALADALAAREALN